MRLKEIDKSLAVNPDGYMWRDPKPGDRIDDRKEKYYLPTFGYINVNQHKQNYYPDMYILDENLIIEVKSEWWWNGKGDSRYVGRYENNMRKKQAVLDAGHDYRVYLFYSKHKFEILEWKA